LPSEEYKILRSLNTKETVHLASDKDGKKVVLKTLAADSASIYKRIAELPSHENSEKIFECFEQGENTIAVCEYIDGITLHELLESGSFFPLKDIKKIICSLCDAVEHLHKNNIIHRDINPNNIMLDDMIDLTLIDYSIARLYRGGRDKDTTILGTQGFSAPEQYGFKETRFTADVYSIGMVLKVLLNCCAGGYATQEVYLRKIAAKCTAFDPNNRYRSATAIKSAVKRSRLVIPAIGAGAALSLVAVFALAMLMQARDADDSATYGSSHQTTSAAATTSATTTVTADSAPPEAATSAVASTTAAADTTIAATTTTAATPETTTTSATTATAATISTTTTRSTTTATTPHTTTATSPVTTTTSATTPVTTPEDSSIYLDINTLVGSDQNNPNKIEVTSVHVGEGNYYDDFEYKFYDDPTVHGKWEYCYCWNLRGLPLLATADGIINATEWLSSPLYKWLSFSADGTATVCNKNDPSPVSDKWTNGYCIESNGDGIFASRLFTVVIDDVEFLFLEHKSGDYVRKGEVYCYYIFTRVEE